MKKQKITQQDYLKAHRKASREEEIARHGRPARFRAVHKSKKAYDRKREKAGLRNLPFSFYQEMPLVYNRFATTNDGRKQFTKGYLRNINIKYDAKISAAN